MLAGKRIVNTRASHQAAELDRLLSAHGAEPLAYPCIAIVQPEDTTRLDGGLQKLAAGDFDWLVLTSANTVYALADRLKSLGIALNGTKVAAIGPSTAKAAQHLLGVEESLIPEKFIAESLAKSLALASGTRIFLPQSDIARPVLAQSLIASGAAVLAVDAYRTVPGSGGVNLPEMLSQYRVDAITFTSTSTAQNFINRLIDEGGSLDDLDSVYIACIGPVTADAVRQIGLKVDVMPYKHTLEGLVNELARHFEERD